MSLAIPNLCIALPDSRSGRSTPATVAADTSEAQRTGCLALLRGLWARLVPPGLSAVQAMRVRISVIALSCMLGAQLVAVAMLYYGDDMITSKYIYIVEDVISVCYLSATLAWILYFKHVSDTLLAVFGIQMWFQVSLIDLQGASRGAYRSWPFMIVLIDLLLVMRAPFKLAAVAVTLTTTWLLFSAIEGANRFGLYDIPGLSSQDERYEQLCACETLPCATGSNAALEFVLALLTFWVDFFITHNFSRQLYRERDDLAAAVDIGRDIGRLLADFDLDGAREALDSAELTIPLGLHTTFSDLLYNLEQYRPYLPQTLLQRLAERCGAETTFCKADCNSPGSPFPLSPLTMTNSESDSVSGAIMFTDIRMSTTIWRLCPKGMSRALKAHMTAVRACINRHQGYEVKTIGDAFMVFFEQPTPAVQCGMDIHEALLCAPWPSSLLAMTECARDPDNVWGGLTLRIGIDHGSLCRELNELTGRYDFFGDVTNRAARIESVCPPGAVAARDAVMQAALAELPSTSYETVSIKQHVLRGFEESDAAIITAVVPARLAHRKTLPFEKWTGTMLAKVRSQQDLQNTSRYSGTQIVLGPPTVSTNRFDGLDSGRGTVASIVLAVPALTPFDTQEMSQYFNTMFSYFMHQVQITNGAIVTTLNDTATIFWRSASHIEESSCFIHSMLRYAGHGRSDDYLTDMHVAVSESSVFYGSIGSSTQRFMTVVGPCVSIAQQLALTAQRAKLLCMWGCSENAPPKLRGGKTHQLLFTDHHTLAVPNIPKPVLVYTVSLCEDDNTAVQHALSSMSADALVLSVSLSGQSRASSQI